MDSAQLPPSFHIKGNAKANQIKAELEAREREARERAAQEFLRNQAKKIRGNSRRSSSGHRSSSRGMAYNRGQSPPRAPRDYSSRAPQDAYVYDAAIRTFDGIEDYPQRSRSPHRRGRSRSPAWINHARRGSDYHLDGRGRELNNSTGPRADIYRPDHTADVRAQRYSNNRAPSETSLSHNTISEARASSTYSDNSRVEKMSEHPKERFESLAQPLNIEILSQTMTSAPTEQIAPTELAVQLGQLFHEISTQGICSATLKIQKSVAEKEVERRAREYKKLKGLHGSYPSVQETQKESLKNAEDALKTIDDQVKQNDETLKKLAIEGMTRLVPSIISAGSSLKQSGPSREEELEETCQRLQKQLEEQKKFIEERFESTESAIGTLRGDLATQEKSAVETTAHLTLKLGKLDGLKARVDSLNLLKLDISKYEEGLAQTNKLIAEKLNVSKFNQGIADSNKLLADKVNASKFKEGIAGVSKLIAEHAGIAASYYNKTTSLESIIQGSKTSVSLPTTVTQLRKAHEELQKQVKIADLPSLQTRLSTIEDRLSASQLNDRLKNMETKLTTFGSRVKAVEDRPVVDPKHLQSRTPTPPPADDGLVAKLQGRFQAVESKLNDLLSMDKGVITVSRFEDLGEDLRSSHNQWVTKESAEHTEKIGNALDDLASKSSSTANEISALQKQLALLESRTHFQAGPAKEQSRDLDELLQIKTSLASLEDRLAAVEHIPQSSLSTSNLIHPAQAPNMYTPEAEKFNTIKAQLLQIIDEKQVAGEEVLVCLIEGLRDSSTELKGRLNTQEVASSSLSCDIQSIRQRLNTLETLTSEIQASEYRTMQQSFQELSDRFVSLQRSSNEHGLQLLSTKTELGNVKNNLQGISTTKAAESVGDVEKRLIAKVDEFRKCQEASNADMLNRIDGCDFNIVSLDKRFQNINTKDHAQFVLAQMDATYPHVRNAQDVMATLTNARSQLDTCTRDIDSLRNKVTLLENQQTGASSSGPVDTVAVQALKTEVQELSAKLSEVEFHNMTQSDPSTEFAELKAGGKELSTRVSAIEKTAADALTVANSVRIDYNNYSNEMSQTAAVLCVDVDEIKEKLKQAAVRPAPGAAEPVVPDPAPTARIGSTPSRAKSASIASGQGRHQRQASTSSAISESRKRKTNGTPISSKSTNGAKTSFSPHNHKRRRIIGELLENNSDDEDFDLQQPTYISDGET